MPPLFFQHFWPKVGEEVTRIVLDSLNSGIVAPNFNETHVVLIPKCKEPMKITDFRPINLYNVVYKIASKAIANSMKKILPSIIYDSQSAFVHHIIQKKIGKICEMALKLDMSKAYDKVEWCWLEKIMKKLGFNDIWRAIIMRCVTSIT